MGLWTPQVRIVSGSDDEEVIDGFAHASTLSGTPSRGRRGDGSARRARPEGSSSAHRAADGIACGQPLPRWLGRETDAPRAAPAKRYGRAPEAPANAFSHAGPAAAAQPAFGNPASHLRPRANLL